MTLKQYQSLAFHVFLKNYIHIPYFFLTYTTEWQLFQSVHKKNSWIDNYWKQISKRSVKDTSGWHTQTRTSDHGHIGLRHVTHQQRPFWTETRHTSTTAILDRDTAHIDYEPFWTETQHTSTTAILDWDTASTHWQWPFWTETQHTLTTAILDLIYLTFVKRYVNQLS